jgi:hypothetical protein
MKRGAGLSGVFAMFDELVQTLAALNPFRSSIKRMPFLVLDLDHTLLHTTHFVNSTGYTFALLRTAVAFFFGGCACVFAATYKSAWGATTCRRDSQRMQSPSVFTAVFTAHAEGMAQNVSCKHVCVPFVF